MDSTGTAIITSSGPWREAMRITLAQCAGGAPDANSAAEATLGTWRRMAELLAPVIGARGVDVIFRRSLYLTGKGFPWLSSGEEHGENSALLAGLKTCLSSRESNEAAEAGYTLLATFVELLTALIGESLTERLLSPVWAPPPPLSEQEIAS